MCLYDSVWCCVFCNVGFVVFKIRHFATRQIFTGFVDPACFSYPSTFFVIPQTFSVIPQLFGGLFLIEWLLPRYAVTLGLYTLEWALNKLVDIIRGNFNFA